MFVPQGPAYPITYLRLLPAKAQRTMTKRYHLFSIILLKLGLVMSSVPKAAVLKAAGGWSKIGDGYGPD